MTEDLIKYKYNDILKLEKSLTTLPKEYEKLYEEKFKIIEKSENYIHINKLIKSMIKIKPKENLSDSDKIKMQIVTLLNKMTNINYDKIKNELLSITYDETFLNYLLDNIYIKIMNDVKYIEIYIDFVIYISTHNNYYINEDINFFVLLIQKCEKDFKCLLTDENINTLKELEKNNINLYFKQKKNLNSLMFLLSNLIKNNLVKKDLIDFVINKLLLKCTIRLELLCTFIKPIKDIVSNELIDDLKIKLNHFYNVVDSRIDYLIDDLFNDEFIIIEKENDNKMNDINYKMKLSNLINEYLEHNNLDESLEYLREFIDNYNNIYEDFIYICFELEETTLEKIFPILQLICKHKQFKNEYLDALNDDFDEINLDYPFAKNYYNLILINLRSNNIINYNTYQLIYKKILE